MYVIVEWNQASGRPRVYGDEVYDQERIAQEVAADAAMDASRRGRREVYTVNALDDDARWDSGSNP